MHAYKIIKGLLIDKDVEAKAPLRFVEEICAEFADLQEKEKMRRSF